MKYFAYLIVALIITGSLIYTYKNQNIAVLGKETSIEGKVLTGKSIGKDYCEDKLYIVPDTLVYPTLQLRSEEGDYLENSVIEGKRVVITGLYSDSRISCEALTCECEEYVTVTDIEVN